MSDKPQRVKDAFDAFMGEAYYGTNMKLVMVQHCTDEEIDALKRIAERCKKARDRLLPPRPSRSPQDPQKRGARSPRLL